MSATTPARLAALGTAAVLGTAGPALTPVSAEPITPTTDIARTDARHVVDTRATVRPTAADLATRNHAPDAFEPGDSRARMYRDLSLIRGHMFVVDDLMRTGKWTEALSYAEHPRTHLQPAVADKLRVHGLQSLDVPLGHLIDAIRAQDPSKAERALTQVDQRLTKAFTKLTSFMVAEQTLCFAARMAHDVLGAVEHRLGASPDATQVMHNHVRFAEALYSGAAKDFRATDAQRYRAINRTLADLRTLLPQAASDKSASDAALAHIAAMTPLAMTFSDSIGPCGAVAGCSCTAQGLLPTVRSPLLPAAVNPRTAGVTQ